MSPSNKDLQQTMVDLASGDAAGEELMFDPRTGELTVVGPNQRPDRDALPATEMAREGFFVAASAAPD